MEIMIEMITDTGWSWRGAICTDRCRI